MALRGPQRAPTPHGQPTAANFAGARPQWVPRTRAAPTQAAGPALEYSPEVAQLAKWLEAGGGQSRGVRDAVDPAAGRTLVTSAAADAGQVLVEVPQSRQLSNGKAWGALNALLRDAPTVRSLYYRLHDGNSGVRKLLEVALVIAAERAKGSSSDWRPYLACLPDVSGMPLLWPEEDVQQLQHGPTIAELQGRRRWVRDLARAMWEDRATYDGVTIDAELLGWAAAVASSRTFSAGPLRELAVLRPMIDFCNHSFEPSCRWEEVEAGMGLVPTRRLAAGEEVTVAYGGKGNCQLLVTYGFIVPGNPHEEVQFIVTAASLAQAAGELPGAPPGAGVQPWQDCALRDWDVLGAEGPVSVQLGGSAPGVDPRLLAAARVLCSEAEADLAGRRRGQLKEWEAQMPRHLEERALHTVAHWCEGFLAEMGTSAEEDEDLLASGLPPNLELAVRYRLQLKGTVAAAIEQIFDLADSL